METDALRLSEAEAEGYGAWGCGIGLADNPYLDVDLAQSWARGWHTAALRMAE